MLKDSISYKINDLPEAVVQVIAGLRSSYKAAGEKALVAGLHGDLGAGKTTFSKECGKQLGVEETMTSPTFVIQKTYQTEDETFRQLVHIDAYRLEDSAELAVLGFKNLLSEPYTLVLIEWPERVADILPESTIHLYISSIDEETREIKSHV